MRHAGEPHACLCPCLCACVFVRVLNMWKMHKPIYYTPCVCQCVPIVEIISAHNGYSYIRPAMGQSAQSAINIIFGYIHYINKFDPANLQSQNALTNIRQFTKPKTSYSYVLPILAT